jgi:hypothetical protein
VDKVLAHRARTDGPSYQLGLNSMADLTPEEFKLRYFGERPMDFLETSVEE